MIDIAEGRRLLAKATELRASLKPHAATQGVEWTFIDWLRDNAPALLSELEAARRDAGRIVWIPVSERTPPLMLPVLTSDGKTVRGAYHTGKRGENSFSNWPRNVATHWAHYPPPPDAAMSVTPGK